MLGRLVNVDLIFNILLVHHILPRKVKGKGSNLMSIMLWMQSHGILKMTLRMIALISSLSGMCGIHPKVVDDMQVGNGAQHDRRPS